MIDEKKEFVIYPVLLWFIRFWVEKNWAKNCGCRKRPRLLTWIYSTIRLKEKCRYIYITLLEILQILQIYLYNYTLSRKPWQSFPIICSSHLPWLGLPPSALWDNDLKTTTSSSWSWLYILSHCDWRFRLPSIWLFVGQQFCNIKSTWNWWSASDTRCWYLS